MELDWNFAMFIMGWAFVGSVIAQIWLKLMAYLYIWVRDNIQQERRMAAWRERAERHKNMVAQDRSDTIAWGIITKRNMEEAESFTKFINEDKKNND